jgi:ABC-2 type transport system permease protein
MRRLRTILSIAVNDLRLTTKERSALFWMLIMPVAFIGLIGGAFGGSSRTPSPTGLAVIDRDASFLSRSFADQLGKERLKVGVFPAEEGDSAKAYPRALTIPKGFSDSLAAGKRVALTLDVARSRDADRDLTARISIYKVIVRTLAALAEADTAGTGAITGASFEEQYRMLLSRPDLIRTEVSVAGKGRVLPSGFGASAPSMLVLFLMVNTVIYGSIFLALEKQNRCLARMGTMPVSRGDILAGKVLGRVMIGLVQSAIMILAGALIYKVWWGPSPLALLVLLVCLAVTSASLGIFLGGLVHTPEQAGAIAWIVPLFLGAIGGCWWPLEVVPRWMQILGHVSPAAWAMDAMHGMLSFGKGPEVILVPCLVLMGYAGLLLIVGARSLKTD